MAAPIAISNSRLGRLLGAVAKNSERVGWKTWAGEQAGKPQLDSGGHWGFVARPCPASALHVYGRTLLHALLPGPGTGWPVAVAPGREAATLGPALLWGGFRFPVT